MNAKHRTGIATVLTAVVLLAVSACGGSDSSNSSTTAAAKSGSTTAAAKTIAVPDDIKQGGLDIATFYAYPPYIDGNAKTGKVGGFEPALVRAIAEKWGGVPVHFHDMKFEAEIPSVLNKRNHMMIGAMGDTPERRAQGLSFLDLYETQLRAIVRKGNPTNVDPSNMCGEKVAVFTSGLEEAVIKKTAAACKAAGKPVPKLTHVSETAADLLAVSNGRSNVVLRDPAVGAYMVKQNPKLEILPTVIPAAAKQQLTGWIIRKDNTALRAALLKAINELIADGTWQRILDGAGVGEAAVVPPKVDGQAAAG
jgi:polar amino acid transport system substrate-binding protein